MVAASEPLSLASLSDDTLDLILAHCSVQSLGRTAQACRRLRRHVICRSESGPALWQRHFQVRRIPQPNTSVPRRSKALSNCSGYSSLYCFERQFQCAPHGSAARGGTASGLLPHGWRAALRGWLNYNPLACAVISLPATANAEVFDVSLASGPAGGDSSLATSCVPTRLWVVDSLGTLHEHCLTGEGETSSCLRSVRVLDCAGLAVEASGAEVIVTGSGARLLPSIFDRSGSDGWPLNVCCLTDGSVACWDSRTALDAPAWAVPDAHTDEVFCCSRDALHPEQFLTTSADE